MSERLPEDVVERLVAFVDRENLEAMRVVATGPGRLLPAVLNTGAVTFGRRVFFRQGRYDVQSARGLALIAHESMHIGQYRELGVVRFMAHYLWGQLRCGFKHDEHPMERDLVLRQREIRKALSL